MNWNCDSLGIGFDPTLDETAAAVGVKKEKDRGEFLQGKTLLVPELVRVHPVPASLWRECQILPFVVTRVQGKYARVTDLTSVFLRVQSENELTLSDKDGKVRDTGSVEPESRPIFGSVSGLNNQFLCILMPKRYFFAILEILFVVL